MNASRYRPRRDRDLIWCGHRLATTEERYSSPPGQSPRRRFEWRWCAPGWRRISRHMGAPAIVVPAIVFVPFDDVPPRLIADARLPRLLATAQVRRAREQRSTRERQ